MSGPHDQARAFRAGAPPARAKAAAVLLHGRGAEAAGMLDFGEALAQPDVAWLAPQAAGRTWYPYPFTAPKEGNEPYLSSALEAVGRCLAELEGEGLPPDRVALIGFSQGGCLALEYAARNPKRYGAVIGLSAGLIGPPGTTWDEPAELDGTPVFLGCSDVDSHIPLARVKESSQVLTSLGADVTEKIYPGFGHAINEDEVRHARGLLAKLQHGG